MENIQYRGYDCIRLQNEAITLLVTVSVGPRVIAFHLSGGDNLFAEVPGLTLEYPGEGDFHFYGGHRLWYAPEIQKRTYLPDDQPVHVEQTDSGVTFTQPVESQTGIQKSISIRLPDANPVVYVNHTLTNLGAEAVDYAPWTITQLQVGGFAILPQATDFADPAGLQPNRSLTFWPYTDIRSPSIQYGNRFLFVDAPPKSGPLKVGFPNPRGWIAYYRAGTLFVKYAPYNAESTYYDLGSSSECYSGPEFIELETLAPRKIIPVGKSVSHQEIWFAFGDIFLTPEEDAVQETVDRLRLDEPPEHS